MLPMKPLTRQAILALLMLLNSAAVLAQDGATRPPEGATQEEKRAFYQKRAAERTRAAEVADSTAPQTHAAAATSSPSMRPDSSGASGAQHPPEGATQEEKRAFYLKRAAEREKAAATSSSATVPTGSKPAAAVDHTSHTAAVGTMPGVAASATKPEDAGRPRMSGMPGMGMGGMRGGSGPIWLSDSPPSRGDAPARSGMAAMGGMGMMGMGSRNGPPTKRLWLRAGSDPVKSGFAREEADAPAQVWLVTPQGSPAGEALPSAEEGKKNLSFPMPVQGYYRLYVTTRKLQADTLNVSVAKAEVSNFSHGGNEEERAVAINASRVLESAPIEIVREKAADEPTFFQLKSGDEQAFVVLQKGIPAQGVRVRFISFDGWGKEAVSDGQGRVSFQVVRDYFPPWNDFQKRFKATYLVLADVSAAEAGQHQGLPYSMVRYQASLSGSYYPSPDDYRSYAWGLGLTVLFVVLGAVAIYVYRRKRVKSFKEVRFDEAE